MLTKIEEHRELTSWLTTRFENLDAQPDTVAYVVNLLASKELTDLMSVGSVVLAYSRAFDFDSKRRLADYVLASEVLFKGNITQPKLCVGLAMDCYRQCWTILRPSWPLYKELSLRLPNIIDGAHALIEGR